MATPNIVPNANNEGRLGKSGQQWSEVRGQSIYQNGQQVANLASPAFTGAPTAPTPATADNTTKIATTAWVRAMLFADAYLPFGAMGNGEIAAYNSATQKMEAVATLATLNARANHTGTQANTTIDNDATLAYPGSTTLADDLAWIDGLIQANTTAIAGLAAASHTHVSADITDATTLGASDKLVKTNSSGGIYGKASNPADVGVTGNAGTVSQATGVFGTANAADSVGVAGYQASGTTAFGCAGLFYVGSSHTKRTILALADSTNQNDIMEFGEGIATSWVPWGFITSKGRLKMKNSGGFYQTIIPSAAATADESWALPENGGAGGTLVGANGQDVVSGDFRTALGLSTTDNAQFATVRVATSVNDGIRFGASAKLAMQSTGSTTIWRLPSGGGASENLVDGDGRGITSASQFRTALGVASAAGGTFTGTMVFNPSSGSTQMQLTGALGFTTSISCNPSAARAISFPDAGGTIVLGDGSGVTDAAAFRTAIGAVGTSHTHLSTDISDSTAAGRAILTGASAAAQRTSLGSTTVGDALFIAANAAAARTTLGVQEAGETLGYCQASESGAAATTTTGTSGATLTTITMTSFGVDDAVNFSVPLATSCSVRYNGSTTKRFKVDVRCAIENMSSSGHEISLAIGKNGSAIGASEQRVEYDGTVSSTEKVHVSCSTIVQLANLDSVEAMIADNDGGTPVDLDVSYLTMTITPI